MVTEEPAPGDVVWLRPETVVLVVEIVSEGSEPTDRWMKPLEYASAGISRYWRVEPNGTVAMFRLDSGGEGSARYVADGSVTLDDLLSGDVPDLS